MLGQIASFASGLGSLAGGLGIGGGGQNRKSWSEPMHLQRRWQMDDEINGLSRHRIASEKAGLHPLAALGYQGSQSPSASVGGGSSRRFDPAQIGQGIGRALNAGKNGMQRKLDELSLEKAQLENDYIKTQIAGAQKAINYGAGNTVPINSSNRSSNLGLNDVLKAQTINKLGVDDGIAPRHKTVVDKDGQTFPVLNTDAVGDNEILMFQDYVARTMPKQIGNYYRRSGKDIYRKMTSKKSPGYWLSKKSKKYWNKIKY